MTGPSGESIQLTIDTLWKRHNRRFLLKLAVPFLFVVSAVVLDILVGPSEFVLTVLIGVLVLSLYLYDTPLTRALRFGHGSRPYLVFNCRGVEGDVYPASWYKPAGSLRIGSSELPPNAQVVRSRLFRRVAEVATESNFVLWNETTIVLDEFEGDLKVGFWTANLLVENSILHEVVCGIPKETLPQFLALATRGGSDLHVGPQLLTDSGRSASVPCLRHDNAIGRGPILERPVRLRTPHSLNEAASWFRFTTPASTLPQSGES